MWSLTLCLGEDGRRGAPHPRRPARGRPAGRVLRGSSGRRHALRNPRRCGPTLRRRCSRSRRRSCGSSISILDPETPAPPWRCCSAVEMPTPPWRRSGALETPALSWRRRDAVERPTLSWRRGSRPGEAPPSWRPLLRPAAIAPPWRRRLAAGEAPPFWRSFPALERPAPFRRRRLSPGSARVALETPRHPGDPRVVLERLALSCLRRLYGARGVKKGGRAGVARPRDR